MQAGDALGFALELLFFAWLFWAFARRRRNVRPIGDEPPGTPYRIHTRAFDRELRARDVAAALAADPFMRRNRWAVPDAAVWEARTAAANRIAVDPTGELADRLCVALEGSADLAVCVLVDHSGSMRDRMVDVAAALRWWSRTLTRAGVPLALLGFTTVGWRGGQPREQWLRKRRPERPGRLCALLHLTYQQFGEALSEADWRLMLNPGILFENIDGEALAWAHDSLRARPERRKLLIVVSDGAPVDDATLTANGLEYLERHLRTVIAQVDTDPEVELAAVGIGCDVSHYYRRSRAAADADALAPLLVELVEVWSAP